MLKGWIIYNKADYQKNYMFAQRFIDKGINIDAKIELVFSENLILGIKDNRLSISVKGKNAECPHFVVNRSRDSFIGKHLELMGCKVYNSSLISEVCNNKAKTHQLVSSIGVKGVDTLFCRKTSDFEGQKVNLEYPLIIKSVSGHGGNEVFKASKEDELIEAVNLIPYGEYIVQRMCTNPGKDLRVFVIGKEIIAAILRTSQKDFRANYSLGGDVSLYELTNKEKEIVQAIIAYFDFGFVGIDFIFDEDNNLLFNEIEDVVGSRSLSMKSSIDVVERYLEHIKGDL